MSLHHDFPFEATNLYCKSCKEKTLHNKPMHEYVCSKCGRTWDELLLQVNLKQNKYGKTYYEAIELSDKPVNATEVPTKTFDHIDDALAWLKEKAEKIA